MPFQDLPQDVQALLKNHAAPPNLVAHLTIVHDVAVLLINRLDTVWPALAYDRQAMLFGAATHDVGKIVHTNELTGPGNQHEEIGPQLLLESGWPETYTRFARTHARWKLEASIQLEDVLVAFADTIWKGQRDEELEREIVQQIARQCQEESWQVYMKLDDIASELALGAHERILWQGKYAL